MITEIELSHRLIAIEARLPYLKEDLDNLYNKIDGLDHSFHLMDKKLDILIQQKNEAETRLGRFKTAGLSVFSALAIGLIGWLAHIAMVVQGAKLSLGGN